MSLSDEPHPLWGRQYSQYTTSYTNEALSAPLISNREFHSQTVASETISYIRKLGISRTNASVDYITLPMLMDLHEEVRDPGKLRFMADPGLVSGCVRLMASVKPSALQYEYGYVSFRILVIALNACSMKHLGYLEETIAHMNSASLADRLSTFWGASSWLFYQKSRANQPVIPVGLVDEAVLDQLLNLLYHDEKLFLVVSKRTCSLGLSGLMSVFLTHATDTKSQDDHHKQVIRPYVRIFWRYLVVISNAEAEEIAIFDLQTRIAPLARLYHEKPVDVEDSVNLVRALNDRLASIRPASALIVAAMLRFVAPMVVPGCEELIPTTVKLCIEILWNSLSSGTDAMYARQTVLNFLLYLRDMLMALKPPQFNHQPWIWEVVDHVIKGDVLDLALRVFSTVSGFNPSDLQGENTSFISL
ncbi:hypothetical protein RSOL_424630 [Rhizoctonia solani AG-3 Rhs1AP]|uniref:Uncharacterized protein n=1 Tax=Rhizoctonia solani AG-3 Rhs1AP TaxID=1086054 RepID=X8JFY3_9AGAM|nr:hypothetical protein RSOL_424630 [Rhizoctonia solani AG-3 Rhs1AP]